MEQQNVLPLTWWWHGIMYVTKCFRLLGPCIIYPKHVFFRSIVLMANIPCWFQRSKNPRWKSRDLFFCINIDIFNSSQYRHRHYLNNLIILNTPICDNAMSWSRLGTDKHECSFFRILLFLHYICYFKVGINMTTHITWISLNTPFEKWAHILFKKIRWDFWADPWW